MQLGIGSVVCRCAVTLSLLAALALVGCGSGSGDSDATGSATPTRGGTLHLAQIEDVTTFDGLTTTALPDITAISQVNETLFRVDRSEKIVPWLVSRYEKADNERVWTLHLRSGVEFSDGKPMTAADVVFSLEAVKNSALWSGLFEAVTSITEASPSTVVIKSKTPNPALPAALALYSAGIVPKNYGGVSAKQFAQHPIGTGPFMVGQWVHGQSLTLDRNPHYWQKGRPYLDSVVLAAVPDDNSRVAQLKGGQLDAIGEPPWSQLSTIASTQGLNVFQFEDGFTDFIILNSRKPLFKDPRVREAVNLAVNREDIVKAAMSGYGATAGPWFPRSLLYADESIKPPAQDLAKAKQLVAEAVKDTGVSPSFTMLTIAGDSYADAAGQIIQQNLGEIGLQVKLQPLDIASIEELIFSGEFEANLLKVYSTIPDPSELAAFYGASDGVFSGTAADEVAQLSKEGSSEPDPDKREQIYHRIQQIIARENGLVTLDDKPWTWGLADDVAGFSVNSTGTPWLAEVGFAE